MKNMLYNYAYMTRNRRTDRKNADQITEYSKILNNSLHGIDNSNLGFMLDKDFERKSLEEKVLIDVSEVERENIRITLQNIASGIYEMIEHCTLIKTEISKIIDFKIDAVDSTDEKQRLKIFKSQPNGDIMGQYLPTVNTVVVNKNRIEKNDTTLIHELLHYLSSEYKDGIMKSGFYMVNYNIKSNMINDIGLGSTEGYTEYLNKLLQNKKTTNTYLYHFLVARDIANIVDNENMLYCYITHNLLALIEVLEYKGFKKEEIYDLILGLDFLMYTYKSNENTSYKVRKEVLKVIKKILSEKEYEICSENKNKDIEQLVKRQFTL